MSSTFQTGACIHVPTHQKELSCGLDNKWYLIYTSSCIGDTCALELFALIHACPGKRSRRVYVATCAYLRFRLVCKGEVDTLLRDNTLISNEI